MLRAPRSRCVRAAAWALLLTLFVSAGLLAPPRAEARGASAAEDEFDREVEREIRAQDRLERSARAQDRDLKGLIQRYNQRVLDEGSPLTQFLLGRIYGLDKQVDVAVRHMQGAINKKPEFHQAHYRLAILYIASNDLANARQSLAAALQQRPDKIEYLLMAAKFATLGRDPQEAKRAAEAVLRVDPEQDEAREMLATAYMLLEQWEQAQRALETLIRKEPQAIALRARWVECALQLKKWDAASGELRNLLSVAPKDPGLRQMMVRAHMGRGDPAAAIKVLQAMAAEDPADWRSRSILAELLLGTGETAAARVELLAVLASLSSAPVSEQTKIARAHTLQLLAFSAVTEGRALRGQEDAAAQERARALDDEIVRRLGEADTLIPLPPHLLDTMQVTLAQLGRHKERLPYLRRLRAGMTGQPEELKRLDEVIGLLESGQSEAPGATRSAAGAMADLIRRCTHEDEVVRREALHEYYDLNIPLVDPIVYQRHEPRVEPDALCRFWVVRILSRFETGTADPEIVRIAARYVGLALEDPVSSVRRGAAAGLGKIAAPAGLLYLIPHLFAMPLEVLPDGEDERQALEEEYNATRAAFSALTGRVDLEIGGGAWIALDAAEANRRAWRTWLDTPDGVAARLAGLDDLAQVRDVDPRWQLRYILVDVIQTKPAVPDAVARKAYQVLRDRVQALSAKERQGDPWWQTFPMFSDESTAGDGLGAVRTAIRGWWETARPKAAGSGR
ncbi:MAG: tetratricopeptide repeat protein [Planctomycetota bacterium]|nr:tetratricopeptide repeat protein [Planctomycetota bacterium]